ncbi:tRNA (N(6)-L-threonylcarbamoyladenosine(37)-C(2))-methylthiotransferase MtaB [Methylobacterium nonmethylotrophicum]|uniref:tRNA (N(6)-L-threonylcarbamoyladenosine(37)-C(2))-methylthiotransferase MtaB n=1 Tax=Methylobacterium nonmethylotrophicum TaxID=1141884 RepID=A0A4Z0NKK4_9HYPH|nr:tRNA (N(6)-L-threonylcarbamoyladenosine(37)-C(2))-methylthiotransferase MtaB [Methylobacterium nonmethylotrophicum]TGD96415.1 tRNA (N(6)-L-threonylcarbamoyladenosine(37)-C(2))-methylthiotransferase MtaB [Methylobacterium nonmethylotrophicum]
MAVEVLSFGCRLNAAESEAMRRQAEEAGRDGLVLVNTCAVTVEAGRQARKAIRAAVRANPAARVVVTGCGAQVETQAYAAMPEVAEIVGNRRKLDPATWANRGTDSATGRIRIDDVMRPDPDPLPEPAPMRARTRAFLPVQNGCDHRCTFCVIPFGRGNSRSVPVETVVAQVRALVGHGTREVVLTGVDLTAYGRDLGGPSLGGLVRAILRAVPDLDRLRLSSIDSVEADPELITALAEEPRLMPHLHLSLQAGDDLILKRMKRRHGRDDAIRFCAAVRRLRPDAVFGADLIAGFPTETEAQFARSLDLVEACGLAQLHVFPYSPRPGTPAARMPQVAPTEIRDRAARLREAGAAALARRLDREVGQTRRVLAERGGIGRTEGFLPVRLPEGVEAGALVDLGIAGHDGQVLQAA